MLDDPNALARFIENLGGTPIEAPTFRFELPMQEVRRVVPRIIDTLGDVGVRRVAERRDVCPTRHEMETVLTLELFRRPKEEARLEEKF